MMNTKKERIKNMLHKILMIGLFVMLLGIAGHFDMQDELTTSDYDNLNKQEVIRDLEFRCFKDELSNEDCKGY